MLLLDLLIIACPSCSLKPVVDEAKGKCIQSPLRQPACCSQRHPPALKLPMLQGCLNYSCHKTAACQPEGRRLYKDRFTCPISESAQISVCTMAFHLPEQAPLAAAQGSLHFRLLGNSQRAPWKSQIGTFFSFLCDILVKNRSGLSKMYFQNFE